MSDEFTSVQWDDKHSDFYSENDNQREDNSHDHLNNDVNTTKSIDENVLNIPQPLDMKSENLNERTSDFSSDDHQLTYSNDDTDKASDNENANTNRGENPSENVGETIIDNSNDNSKDNDITNNNGTIGDSDEDNQGNNQIGNNEIKKDEEQEDTDSDAKETGNAENDLDGSGLITQTMILGSQQDDHNIFMGSHKRHSDEEEEEEDEEEEENIAPQNDSVSTSTSINKPLEPDNHHESDIKYRLEVTVTNPKNITDTSSPYTIYQLNVKTNNPMFSKKEYIINHRYSDFDTLYKCLTFDYPTLLIPPLPNKQRLEYIKGGRFTDEFISKRCNSLNIFMNRIIKHSILSKSDVLFVFLENTDYWNTYKNNLTFNNINNNDSINQHNSSVEGVTDFLMNSFKKPHVESKFNKNFKEIDHQRLKLQENLNKIDKIYSKVVLKQDNISKELNAFGDEFGKLTILLNNDYNGKFRDQNEVDSETQEIVNQFRSFSENLKKSSNSFDELNKYIEFNYLNNLKDLEHYLISLGSLIKLKDYKMLDYEMLNNYLEKTIHEKQNLENGGSLTSTTEGTLSFLSKKLESLTGLRGSSSTPTSTPNSNGTDTTFSNASTNSSLVNERINKLNARIELLKHEKENAKKIYGKFEVDLLEEWNQFKSIKDVEINESLNRLSVEYSKMYSNSFNDWNNLKLKSNNFKIENKLNEQTKGEFFDNNPVLKNHEEIKDMLKDVDI